MSLPISTAPPATSAAAVGCAFAGGGTMLSHMEPRQTAGQRVHFGNAPRRTLITAAIALAIRSGRRRNRGKTERFHVATGSGGHDMGGKRALWRDRCLERMRERRRRQGRVMAVMMLAATDEQAAVADAAAPPSFDISSWLRLRPAGEATRGSEAPLPGP